MSSQADHGGHRERMRKRFKESGNFKGFSEHEILEMLLFYIVPRKNTNDIAHELIKKFGSLNSVLNASVEELSSVKASDRAGIRTSRSCAWHNKEVKDGPHNL